MTNTYVLHTLNLQIHLKAVCSIISNNIYICKQRRVVQCYLPSVQKQQPAYSSVGENITF